MIRIRLTGLSEDVQTTIKEMKKHFEVLNESKECRNSNSVYVRVYADIEKKEQNRNE